MRHFIVGEVERGRFYRRSLATFGHCVTVSDGEPVHESLTALTARAKSLTVGE